MFRAASRRYGHLPGSGRSAHVPLDGEPLTYSPRGRGRDPQLCCGRVRGKDAQRRGQRMRPKRAPLSAAFSRKGREQHFSRFMAIWVSASRIVLFQVA